MYIYVKSVCLGREIGSQWHEVNLQNILVYDIFNNYRSVFLELSNVYLDDNVFVDMKTLRIEFSLYHGTLNELLTEIGTRTLETVTQLPTTTIKYANYSDAFRANYKIEPHKINPGDTIYNDLKINRPRHNTDMQLVHNHCLVSVNGYLHLTVDDGLGEYCYVKDGNKSCRQSLVNTLGIWSFLDIGSIKKVPLTLPNIHAEGTRPLKERMTITTTENLTNKTTILSLGGYLVFPEPNIFWQSSEQVFSLNISALPFAERYYESIKYIDLSNLELTPIASNPKAIDLNELLSDNVLKKFMQLSQTFLIIVDNPDLYTNKIFIKNCNLPGMFTAYQDPTYPLIVGYGKIADYWKVYEDGYWSVTVADSYYHNYNFTHQPPSLVPIVTDQSVPNLPYYQSRGFLLEVGALSN